MADDQVTGGATDEVLWSLADHQGSVRRLVEFTPSTDAIGVAADLVYNAFGEAAGSATPDDVDFLYGYTGREYDAETGLQYNRARYYDPRNGRFLSEDPSGFAGGDANLYRYVGNNVVNATDPTGLATRFLGNAAHTLGGAIGGAATAFASGSSAVNPANIAYAMQLGGAVGGAGFASAVAGMAYDVNANGRFLRTVNGQQYFPNSVLQEVTARGWSGAEFDGGTIGVDPTYFLDVDNPVHQLYQVHQGRNVDWADMYRRESRSRAFNDVFWSEAGASFNDGRAFDSASGAVVEGFDSGADLGVAVGNGVFRAGFGALNWITGNNKHWVDYERSGRLSDYVSPLYGHGQEFQQGQVVGHYTVRAQAAAATAWGGARLAGAFPGMANALWNLGAGAFGTGSLTVSGGGALMATATSSWGVVGGTLAVSGGGLGIASAGIGLYESGAFGPLMNWAFATAPEGGGVQFPNRPPSSPAIDGSPYSPREVSRRQSELRRQLGLEPDPNTPIPDQPPGRNVKSKHSANEGTPHSTQERNVNPHEEHSRRPKGGFGHH